MAEEFKKTGLMDGMGEGDDDAFKHDPEGGGNAKYRLPYTVLAFTLPQISTAIASLYL